MRAFILLIIMVASAFGQISLPATLSIGETTYTEVVYQSHDAARVKFSHADGLSSVDISKLPPDIQSALGYDPAAAAEKAAEHEANKAAVAAQLAEKKRAASEKLAQGDIGRQENVAATANKNLQASIAAAEREIATLSRQYEDSVGAWEDRKVAVNQYGVEYELKNSRNIGKGGDPNSAENKARRDRIRALQDQVAAWKKQLTAQGS